MNSEKKKFLPLVLTEEQTQDLEKLAGIAFSPEKIALYFGIPEDDFMHEFNQQDSQIKYHYDKGLIESSAKIGTGNLTRAKDGNLTSIAQHSKDMLLQRIEISKKRNLYAQDDLEYQKLKELIEQGKESDIPADQLEYFEKLDYIRSLYNKYESKNFIIHAVSMKWPDLSRRRISKLISETLNFFYIDNDVKIQAYQKIYADLLDNMGKVCMDSNDFETARRCYADAAKYRGVGSDKKEGIPKELLDRRPVFFTIHAKDVGIQKESRHAIAEFIDSLPINQQEKNLARRDAQIDDVEFILLPEDDEN